MGIEEAAELDWHVAEAALMWQIDLGVEDWVLDAPLNRYDLPESLRPVIPAAPVVARQAPAAQPRAPLPPPPQQPKVDVVAEAKRLAAQADTLEALRAALAGFEHCDLRRGARNLVFADGKAGARVLILGEAPSAEEDREGRPFVGAVGQMLDQMFAAIGLSRQSPDAETGLYLTSVMPWRPPGNRELEPQEIAMMQPFVARHIALAAPEVIVVMGNAPLTMVTGARGILKARGQWMQALDLSGLDLPVLPIAHPGYLLRNPLAKREAWADLLSLQKRLRG